MRINVHAGHNPDGKTACGAIGFIKESTEARNVKNEVISQLRQLGHTVYDCTCENGTSKADVLGKIVKLANGHAVDLDVSIHFNAAARDFEGDGKTTGVEVHVYNAESKAKAYASRVCAAIAELGYKNRGVKYSGSLYVLRHTKAPAMLIECCFVDDKDDVAKYDYREMADAIVYGITGKHAVDQKEKTDKEADNVSAETTVGNCKQIYRVQVGAYNTKSNAAAMKKKLEKAGFDAIVVKA